MKSITGKEGPCPQNSNWQEKEANKKKEPELDTNVLSAEQRRNTLFRLLQQHGDIGDTAFGEQLNADRTTIYRDLKAMEKAGIVHQNGAGWTPGPQP